MSFDIVTMMIADLTFKGHNMYFQEIWAKCKKMKKQLYNLGDKLESDNNVKTRLVSIEFEEANSFL